MGFMSQRYVPHCCLVYLTEKQKYLTKIIKCDEELILKDIGSIDIFKEKIVKGEFLKMIFFYMKEVKMEVKFMFGSVNQQKKINLVNIFVKKNQ